MISKLQPYYQAICAMNIGRKVWLIEDNAPPYVKANRFFREEKKQYSIRTIDQPSNSLDLYLIKNTFFNLKKEVLALALLVSKLNVAFRTLATTLYRLLTTRPCKDADGYTNFRHKIKARVSNKAFKEKAEAVLSTKEGIPSMAKCI